MKNILYAFLILTSVFGCDYYETSEFKIFNESTEDMVIRANTSSYDNGIRFDDSIYHVPAGGFIEFIQDMGNSGRFIPPDYYESSDAIPPVTRFDFLIEEIRYDTLRLRRFWEFSAELQVGTYSLYITDELLDGL